MSAARGLFVVLAGPITVLALLFGTRAWAAGSDVTVAGKLIDAHSDDFDHGKAVHQYRLETDQGSYELQFIDKHPELARASRVTVHGQRSGNTITVAAGGIKAAQGSTTAVAATGAKRVAVILFTFSDSTTQPYTPAYAQGVAFTNANSVAAYYDEASWGELTLSGDVFGWYQIPDKSTSCDWSQWGSDAAAAARAAGVDLGVYDYRVYAFPKVSACGWGGLSYLTGTESWLNGPAGMSVHVMAHELGHNFGTHHANSYTCTEAGVRVSLSANSANCTSMEYGDPYSVMGGLTSRRDHTSFSRANFGWLAAANTLDVSRSGTYTLAPIGPYDPTGVQALRIKRDASTYFLLELRQPYGSYFDNFSATDPVVNGITVRIVPSYSTLTQSQLVDTTPATASYEDAGLAVGRSLFDPLSKVALTTTAVATGGATVQVTFGQDTSAPSAPTNLGATATDATHVALTWNPSTDNVGVAGYKLYRGGSYLTTTTSTSYSDGGLVSNQTYSYSVTAVDAAGNQSTSSNTAVATTPGIDTSAPSVPTGLSASASDSTHITLSWGASTDNVGVAGYLVYRGGSQVGQTSSTSFTDSGLAAATTYTYSVATYDAAGNTSAPSSPVTVATYPAPDTQPPSPPGDLQATVGKGRKVQLSWTAADDNVGVTSYEIVCDDVTIGAVQGTLTYVDNARRGAHNYYVVAVDAAGNRSLPSILVTVAI
jgi:chitodextrinase